MASSRVDYLIRGMDCAEEVSLLRRAFDGVSGVQELRFDVVRARMTVEFDPTLVAQHEFERAVASTGMGCEPWSDGPANPSKWVTASRLWLTASSGVLTALGALMGAGGSVTGALTTHNESHSPLVIACYAAAILLGVVYIAPKAWAAARSLRPEMNVLVCVSIAGACYLGEWSEGAGLSFLFSLAGLLEAWSMDRARSAVAALMRVAPEEATVLHDHGEHRMTVDRVTVGELVRIRPGERVPCDGEVRAGGSNVDQALITGEPIPVWKGVGDEVFAGSMNADGLLDVRVTKPAGDTTLARIVRMVSESGARRSPSEQFVEKFSRIYTPAVLVAAILVALLPPLFTGRDWPYWFYQGMVVLLISCPCALVISTPVTMVAALASSAREGVLVKGGIFLEEIARMRAFAFDKTGVLTRGEPQVERFLPLSGHSKDEILERLAAVERQSEHPLAKAIVQYAQGRKLRSKDTMFFQAIRGRGAEAEVEGQRFWVGSHRMLADKGIETPETERLLAELEDDAHTAVFCGTDREAWAMVSLVDPLRPESASVISKLRAFGARRLVMLTGDNPRAASQAAKAAGLDYVRAELLPEDKATEIAKLRKEFGKVAMVGDGINDAQALAAADIGIALGRRATDVALETADVVLMSDDLSRLPFLLAHARRASNIIRQNIVIALGLKAGFFFIALAGMATLWMAVAADMGATLLVTVNGLRLLRARS